MRRAIVVAFLAVSGTIRAQTPAPARPPAINIDEAERTIRRGNEHSLIDAARLLCISFDPADSATSARLVAAGLTTDGLAELRRACHTPGLRAFATVPGLDAAERHAAAAKVLARLLPLCPKTSAAACDTAGVMLRRGDAGQRDNTKARDVLDSGCRAGSANACGNLALGMLEDHWASDSAAMQMAPRACTGGSAVGCYVHGTIISTNWRLSDVERAQAITLLRRACSGGDWHGCMAAANWSGGGVTEQEAKAFKTRACALLPREMFDASCAM